jgi:hypothetical protein
MSILRPVTFENCPITDADLLEIAKLSVFLKEVRDNKRYKLSDAE